MSWQILGEVEPKALTEARNQAHQAAQVVAAVGETLIDHVPDTSHTALVWSDAIRGLAGQPAPRAGNARVGLRLAALELVVVDAAGAVRETLPLAGTGLAEVGSQVMETLGSLADGPLEALGYPTYELPPHPLADGAAFEAHEDAQTELQHWFQCAHETLTALRATLPDPSSILCWPHHFDIAVLSTLASDTTGNATKTIGVGMSPGDAAIDEPYWYVNHWPTATNASPAPLPAGEWTSEGFVGSVLRASEITASPGAARQELVGTFLEAAVAANRALIDP